MLGFVRFALLALAVIAVGTSASLAADPTEKRLGLVIGNAEYKSGPLPTAANDAGLIAQTLQAAGFDVMGARDLDGDTLRHTFRDFVDKVSAAGPNAVAFVYMSGHGLQFEGDNFFVPVDARIDRDLDVPSQALRISDYVRLLGSLKAKAVVVVLDAARANPFARTGQPLAGGLTLVEPAPGVLLAFNAAPGTISPVEQPPYGSYAQALAEMIREGGLPVGAVFDRVRLRVNEATHGAAVPWHVSQIQSSFVFFQRGPDAPVTEASYQSAEIRRARPIREFNVEDAYHAALERDTLQGYIDFLEIYSDHPLAKRVRAMVAARREAITWRKTRLADTPDAYWSYLDRYARGPHAWDARRRLAYLTAPPDPPRVYTVYDYDLPPPPPAEIVYIERPFLVFDDPVFLFAPPPPPPLFFIPPPPPLFFFGPPPPPIALFVLPVPPFQPVPIWVTTPVYVAPPPNNVIFQNIHNTTIINNTTIVNQTTGNAAAPQGGPLNAGAGLQPGLAPAVVGAGAVAVAAGVAAAAVALPPSVSAKAATLPRPGGQPSVQPASVPSAVPPGVTPPGGTPAPSKGAPSGLRQPGAAGAGLNPPGAPGTQKPAPLPGTTQGAPLPQLQDKSGPVSTVPPKAPGALRSGQPKPATVPSSPSLSPTGSQQKPILSGQPTPPVGAKAQSLSPNGAQGQPRAAPATTAQPSPPSSAPANASSQPRSAPSAAASKAASTPPRQIRVERAAEDSARIEQQLQQQRERQLEARRQQDAAQQRAREQQALQRQSQLQAEQQRRAQEQQRLQQAAQQRQQQTIQRQPPPPPAAQRPPAPPAAKEQKKCGVPGTPPCH